jgi:hypothetical protein
VAGSPVSPDSGAPETVAHLTRQVMYNVELNGLT